MPTYKLRAPGFPMFRPIPANITPPRRFREWGKGPTVPVISIGLPHASDVRAPEPHSDAEYPVDLRAQQKG